MLNTGGMIVCGTGSIVLGLVSAQVPPLIDSLWLHGGALGLAACMVWFWRKDAKEREKNLGKVIEAHRRDIEAQHQAHMTDMKTVMGESVQVMKRVAQAVEDCPRKDGAGQVRT